MDEACLIKQVSRRRTDAGTSRLRIWHHFVKCGTSVLQLQSTAGPCVRVGWGYCDTINGADILSFGPLPQQGTFSKIFYVIFSNEHDIWLKKKYLF